MTTYDPAKLPAGTRPLVAWYDPATGVWFPVDTTADAAKKTLTAQLPHLSIWSVISSGVGGSLGGVPTSIAVSTVAGAAAVDNALVSGVD